MRGYDKEGYGNSNYESKIKYILIFINLKLVN